ERPLGAAGQQDGIVFGLELPGRDIGADVHTAMENDAFGLHLLETPVDDVLLELEVGNAIAKQAAGLRVLLVDVHVVSRAGELLRGGQARRPRPDDGYPLAGLALGRLRHDPAFLEGPFRYRIFDRLYGDRLVVDVERAGRLAGRGADAARYLREVIRRVQVECGSLPVALIDEIVPVGDLVVHRAAVVAVGDSAVHAARRLRAHLVLRQRHHELAPVPYALLDRLVAPVDALEFQEAGNLAHCCLPS